MKKLNMQYGFVETKYIEAGDIIKIDESDIFGYLVLAIRKTILHKHNYVKVKRFILPGECSIFLRMYPRFTPKNVKRIYVDGKIIYKLERRSLP